jgi:hypothetical protein
MTRPDEGTPREYVTQRGSARVRERARLKRQLGETEGEVVARKGREVEIHAQDVI